MGISPQPLYQLRRTLTLEDEKLKAQGREELDPLSKESAFKKEEIQKAKRSFSKLYFAISSQVLQKSELHTAKHHDLGWIPQKHDTWDSFPLSFDFHIFSWADR